MLKGLQNLTRAAAVTLGPGVSSAFLSLG